MFVQRQFQKYQKRSADEQQVSLLLKDFEDADQLLGRVSPHHTVSVCRRH